MNAFMSAKYRLGGDVYWISWMAPVSMLMPRDAMIRFTEQAIGMRPFPSNSVTSL